MAIDVNKIVRQYLTTSATGLYTLCSDRVAVLKKQTTWTAAQKCIVFAIRGGDTDPHNTVKRPSMQFLCYGGSDNVQDAMDVALALEDRLTFNTPQTVSAGVLMDAVQETEAQPLVDPDTKETYVHTTWELECRATA